MCIQNWKEVVELSQDLMRYFPKGKGYIQKFGAEYAISFTELIKTSRMQRLRSIQQMGAKGLPYGVPRLMIPFCDGNAHLAKPLEPFDRFEHSLRVTALMLAFCALHDVPFVDTYHACLAAMTHDIGHAPFSHSMDMVLKRRGEPTHEETGEWIWWNDVDLKSLAWKHDINVNLVLSIIREEGDLGARQSFADTCTYIMHDTELLYGKKNRQAMMGGFAWGIMHGVKCVENGRMHILDRFPFEEFLQHRLMLFTDFYFHPINLVQHTLFTESIHFLIEKNLLTINAARFGTEAHVKDVFLRATREFDAPRWLRSAYEYIFHSPRAIEHWSIQEYDTEQIARLRLDPEAFLITPVNVLKKHVPISINGKDETISIHPNSVPAFLRKWYVFSFQNLP